MVFVQLEKITPILRCVKCKSTISMAGSSFICDKCGEVFPIINGIPRFVPESYYDRDNGNETLVEKTKNYFGYEWDYFHDWGFIDDTSFSDQQKMEVNGGTINARKSAFDSKCRLTTEELKEGNIILDAGCGNGRYTYEAASRGKSLIIGIDVGYGSVKSAFENNKENPNVIIIQANLFDLPFIDNTFDAAFSNGVLMHTGNAKLAFYEVARTIKENGTLVVHLYHKLNPVWEFNDFVLRKFTTKFDIDTNIHLATVLAKLGKIINKNSQVFHFVNLFVRIQPTIIHMYDWYSAPIATHHTYSELAEWYTERRYELLDEIPLIGHINRPWGFNLKGRKIDGNTSDLGCNFH